MAAGVLPSSTAGTVSPVEREARWTLFARFATEAAGDTEARSVLRQALAGLDEELPLHGEPVVHPRWPRNPDEIWVAELAPDLTRLQVITPDDAKTRCRSVQGHFPIGVGSCRRGLRGAEAVLPPRVQRRSPGLERRPQSARRRRMRPKPRRAAVPRPQLPG